MQQLFYDLIGHWIERYLGPETVLSYFPIFIWLWSWEYARRSFARGRRLEAILCGVIGAIAFGGLFWIWHWAYWKLFVSIGIGVGVFLFWLKENKKALAKSKAERESLRSTTK